jgi:DNA-binding transcriptional LysR family regulator
VSKQDTIPFPQKFLNRTLLDDPRIFSGQFWGELRVFLAVAKAGSFNRAADLLATSQPTVSRKVKRLQDLMGAQLLVPTQTGIRLTSKGEQLARSLAALDQSLFTLSNDLKAESRDEDGLVRVSVTDGLGVFFMVPALREFSSCHPRIQIALQSPFNLNDLRENQTDLMVGFAPIDASDVTCRPLGTLHLIPVVSREYVKQHGVPTRRNLHNHHFIQSALYTAENPLWEPWKNLVAGGRVAHYSENSFAYGMMVKSGLGIGLLGSYTVIEPAASPLVEFGVHIPLRLYAAALTERLGSRPAQLAFKWICEIFGQGNPWFADELSLTQKPSVADDGFRIMFNLSPGPTHRPSARAARSKRKAP